MTKNFFCTYDYHRYAIENDKICEIELSLPGPRVFASSKENNYELAVKNTISDLEIQLKKRKELNKPYV